MATRGYYGNTDSSELENISVITVSSVGQHCRGKVTSPCRTDAEGRVGVQTRPVRLQSRNAYPVPFPAVERKSKGRWDEQEVNPEISAE